MPSLLAHTIDCRFFCGKQKKIKKKNRQGEGWTTAPLSDPQTLGTSAVAAGKKGPLIPWSVATRNTAIFSHVFQPFLLFLPAEQPFGRWSGLEIQTEMKRYQPMQNSERDIHSSTKLMIKPWWKSLPEWHWSWPGIPALCCRVWLTQKSAVWLRITISCWPLPPETCLWLY